MILHQLLWLRLLLTWFIQSPQNDIPPPTQVLQQHLLKVYKNPLSLLKSSSPGIFDPSSIRHILVLFYQGCSRGVIVPVGQVHLLICLKNEIWLADNILQEYILFLKISKNINIYRKDFLTLLCWRKHFLIWPVSFICFCVFRIIEFRFNFYT